MLPVPPLDGSKLLLAARIPIRVYIELARFGFMLLIVVISMTDLGPRMSLWAIGGSGDRFAVPLAAENLALDRHRSDTALRAR